MTSLTYMGVRVYSPALGRFLQLDPVLGGNETSYGYPNDPVASMDVTGSSSGGVWDISTCVALGPRDCWDLHKIKSLLDDYLASRTWEDALKNAARHYMAAQLWHWQFGWSDAYRIAYNHERGSTNGQDTRVDWHNNWKGWQTDWNVVAVDDGNWALAWNRTRANLYYVAIPMRFLWCGDRDGTGVHRCRWGKGW